MKRMHAALSGSCLLLLSILLVPLRNSAAESIVLAYDVYDFTVLNDTEVLFCDRDYNFFIVNTQPPFDKRPWDPGWDPTDSGWEMATTLVHLTSRAVSGPEVIYIFAMDTWPALIRTL